jgi:putative ABC transport system permease protein
MNATDDRPLVRTGRPLAVRLYGALARLLPADLGRDREDMAAAFADLWTDTDGRASRTLAALRSFTGLGAVIVMEWLEFLGAHPAPGRAANAGGMRRGGMGLGRNLRYALRTLGKSPAFTLTSVLLVAVGVGAVTTIFTLVDHVLLRPLPYPEAELLVALDDGAFSGPLFRELEKTRAVEEWAAAWTERVNLVGAGEPLRLEEARISADFFHLFGARAQRGRLLAGEDFSAPGAVVLSGGAWQRIWGGDEGIVGTAIEVDGQPLTVVGIVEDGFAPPEAVVGAVVDLWRPLDWSAEELNGHEYSVLEIAGRRAAGVGVEAVQAEVDALVSRMAEVHQDYADRDGSPRSIPVLALADKTVGWVRTGLGLLMGAVTLLLLVACANVAHLFLARGLGRSREMAVRRAMGASTASLAGQLLTESLVVGLAGGVLGGGLAAVGIRAFVALNPTALPRQAAVEVDPRVLAFAVGVSALTSLVFGLLPALRSMRGELADELRGAGRTATLGRGVGTLRNALVVGEVAISLVLVAAAGLLLRSFMTVRAQEPGFDVAGVWTVPLNLADPGSPEEYREIMDEVIRQVGGVAGVRAAAYGLTAPMDRTGGTRCCWRASPSVAGRAEGDPALNTFLHPVSVRYLETVGVELVAGRAWTESDASAEPVPLVVNETYARELAGSPRGALGMALGFPEMEGVVVGVAADNRHYGLDQPVGHGTYLPIERLPFPIPFATVVVRVDPATGGSIAKALREAVWAAAPSLPVPTVRSMQEAVDRSTAGRRFEWSIFAAFGAVALLLAAGGLYGTLLYVAGQRKRELGIRLALGATRGRIEGELIRAGVALGLVGVTLGLGGAWLSNRLLESRIWGVDRSDPLALGGAALLLLVTSAAASWLPARRAGRVDPLETLRME